MLARVDRDTAMRAGVVAVMRVAARKQEKPPVERPELMDHQRPPEGDWNVWLLIGGRGSGKTEAGARYVDTHARGAPCLKGSVPHRIAIIAPSHDDAVDTCVRGESGLLQQNPAVGFHPGAALQADLTWPNGAEAELYGAFAPEDVERLRGPQHCLIWGDEFAAWRKMRDAWDMAMFGLRLGDHPHTVLTTTPKRRPLLKELIDAPDSVTTGAKTSANPHLPQKRRDDLYRKYGGTTLGRQELDAEFLEDIEGALWKRDLIVVGNPPARMEFGQAVPQFSRIVVAIDPAVTSGEDSDETGIVVCALGADGRGYVLEDVSGRMAPAEWAKRAIGAYDLHAADRIVAEANNGGDLVSTVIAATRKNVPVELVHAARGKKTRAEPVAALYEQKRVIHTGPFPELEDQMCSYTGEANEDSPDRMDALVWGLSQLFNISVKGGWGGNQAWGAAA